jgi:glucosamine-6-phosphate deaminase
MEIIIQPTSAAAINLAASLVAGFIRQKPEAVLGLATGGTQELLYHELVEQKLDWSRVTTFNLDEYAGLTAEHPQSYHSYMSERLFRHINIDRENTNLLDGSAEDVRSLCESYERKITAAGGIDLQLLGLGTGGHIGFNEPSSSLASRTRIKTLTPQTRRDNARYFGSEADVPHHVFTMGIGTILEARHCLLLALGAKKAHAVAAACEGPVTAMVPASALQLHRKVTVCLDEEAAEELKLKDYYRWAYQNKPDWQRT